MRTVKLASTIGLLAVVLLLWSMQDSDDDRAARRGSGPRASQPDAGLPERDPKPELRTDPLPPLDTAIPPNPPAEGDLPLAHEDEPEAWEVFVRDARNQPAVHVRMTLVDLRARPHGYATNRLVTDVEGRATLSAGDPGYTLRFDGGPARTWHIRQPKTIIRLAGLIPARVLVVNATTGRRVSKATVHSPQDRLDPFQELPPRLPLRRGYYEFAVFRGAPFEAVLELAPPEGMAPARWPFRFGGHVSARASSLDIVLPLWPEADVRARVLREDGTVIKLPQFTGAMLGRDRLRAGAEASGKVGVMRIRGVPLIPAEEIAISASAGDLFGTSKLRLHRSDLRYETDITVALGIGGGAGGGIHGGRSGRRGTARRYGAGRVGVSVEDGHGRAARFVLLRLTQQDGVFKRSQRTTVNGVATFLDVPGGTFMLELIEPGYVYTAIEVEIGEGGSAQVVLRERRGRRARIEVFDQDGFAAAFVRVTLKPQDGPAFVAVGRHEVQKGVLYTDRSGRLHVEHLPHLRVKVEARRGGSWADGSLERDQASLTLHLKR